MIRTSVMKELRRSSFIILHIIRFFLTNIKILRAAGEGGGYFFNSCLPLPPALQTIRH